MARFITYIPDAELESNVIQAINSIDGELLARAVSIEQLKVYEQETDITLLTSRKVSYPSKTVILDKAMSVEEIAKTLSSDKAEIAFNFQKGSATVASFVGLSGGVGTTSIAINYAFEKANDLNVVLVDLNIRNSDIAIALGLHRIENRLERISKNLQVIQGLPPQMEADLFVFDVGSNLQHPILRQSNEIYLLARLSLNTINRLKSLDFSPNTTIFNFFEKSSFQQHVRRMVEDEYPRVKYICIPNDTRSFERAASGKSALIEVAANSLARKSIATLG